jgi:hypothetical protein
MLSLISLKILPKCWSQKVSFYFLIYLTLILKLSLYFNRHNLASKLLFVQEKNKGKLVLAYGLWWSGTAKKMASENGTRITCHVGATSAPASSRPHFSSPTPCLAFFYQGLLDNNYQNQTQAHAQSQPLHPAPHPSAEYHSSPVCTTFPYPAYSDWNFCFTFGYFFFLFKSALLAKKQKLQPLNRSPWKFISSADSIRTRI